MSLAQIVPPNERDVPAPDFHAISVPRRTFTGDFWFARLVGSTLWFALGDVAGKGAAAAIWMAMIQEELDMRIRDGLGPEPCTLVRRIDEVLGEELPPNRFATLLVGRLDADGALRVANAGHCPLLIVRASGEVMRIAANGPAVGILRSGRWESTRVQVEQGDLLIAFSDGLPEASLPEGGELGIAGVETLAAARRGEDPRTATRRLAESVARVEVDDDVTLFAARRR